MAVKKPTPRSFTKETFSETLLALSSRYSLHSVFDDFLTMAICCFSFNSQTGISFYEEEYLATIGKYKKPYTDYFGDALAQLIIEMEAKVTHSLGNDVLGDFFEKHISNGRNGQYFTPFPVCMFMASICHTESVVDNEQKPLSILDPACGSGRMLIAAHRTGGVGNYFYGVDIDRTCVKIAALNLFLNGMWHSEVLCANALLPNDFVISYRISLLPFGIFKVTEKEKSHLWHMLQKPFEKAPSPIIVGSKEFPKQGTNLGTQLDLF